MEWAINYSMLKLLYTIRTQLSGAGFSCSCPLPWFALSFLFLAIPWDHFLLEYTIKGCSICLSVPVNINHNCFEVLQLFPWPAVLGSSAASNMYYLLPLIHFHIQTANCIRKNPEDFNPIALASQCHSNFDLATDCSYKQVREGTSSSYTKEDCSLPCIDAILSSEDHSKVGTEWTGWGRSRQRAWRNIQRPRQTRGCWIIHHQQ